ncbi:MAG: chemotaxis-specific protein-glutamate methyltransferase CheB [Parachlamydiales bacterium]|jgi:two-component system response regulator WspF
MKIAIVNDDPAIIKALQTFLKQDPSYKLVWIAKSGDEAIANSLSNLPDLILMDIAMPGLNGVETTKYIMQHTPTAIIIVTFPLIKETHLVFEAIGEGAIDALNVTLSDYSIVESESLHYKIQTIGRLKGKILSKLKKTAEKHVEPLMANKEPFPILLTIGASTGGPVALSKILTSLPSNLPLAIVIIQHVDERFIGGLAHWLKDQSGQNVKLITAGDIPKPGVVLLASKNQHLVVRHNGTLNYTTFPKGTPYIPSVDVFYHSLYQHWPQKSIAILLTGMGNDGAQGMKSLREKGWHTIAEHEKSCVIFGMPRAAIEAGGAEEVVECGHMPAAILTAFREIAKAKG